jgi:hypothetical protein
MRSKIAAGILLGCVSLVVVGTGLAGDPVKSGLAPGAAVSAFNVEDITGPNKGDTLCYR